MLRVIFDTNIYGKLIKESDYELIERRIKKEKEFKVYGYRKIRNEIKKIPKKTKESKKARIHLLITYDNITGNKFLEHSIKITNLAKKYYDYYRQLGGIYNWESGIRIDFMIVACATFNNLDLVYSDDKKTLSGKTALKAYKHINLKENLRTPNFLKYNDLLRKFRELL